eukprot:gene36749-40977_t
MIHSCTIIVAHINQISAIVAARAAHAAAAGGDRRGGTRRGAHYL